ncbi:MAG: hypothetical protein R3310_16515 [Candidatus Competibacteraceae bacterium]|nr:hypothetical protein [Candidatus Competibacteraceae bacterium]
MTVTLRFRNSDSRPWRVLRYRLIWPQGSVTANPSDLVVPAGGWRERIIRVDYRHGGIRALLDHPGRARVEILETRAVP